MSDAQRHLTYFEIDLEYCANDYGVSPCTAEVGVTGTRKCFNTQKTCQDRPNFVSDPVTLRFAYDLDYLPRDIDCIPSMLGIATTPGVISLGKDLGQRATVTITFADGQHPDTGPGFDKYLADRDYNPVQQGTFWGKFRARQPFLRGRPCRIIRGTVGQQLDDMVVENYVADSFMGPTIDGQYQIILKDVLKLADDERSLCPIPSNGKVSVGIDHDDVSLALTPTGIGDLEYPAAGRVCIGGNEVCVFSRSGDTLTLVRGQNGTTGVAHAAGQRVQLCYDVQGQDPVDVLADMYENFANINPAFIPIGAWQTESAAYLDRTVTTVVTEPTGVRQLASELIEQCALAQWWDPVNQLIQLRVLRNIPGDARVFDMDNVMEGVFGIKEQPDKRLSQVMTYFGQRNATRPINELDNYVACKNDIAAQQESDEGSAVVKSIPSRWIPAAGEDVATRVNQILLGRFQVAPRLFTFNVFKHGAEQVELGGGYRVAAYPLQDDTGAATTVPVQVVSLKTLDDRWEVTAEEVAFSNIEPTDLTNRQLTISTSAFNLNMRSYHDTVYPEITDDDAGDTTLTITVPENVRVGSQGIFSPAMDIGDWPVGLTIILKVYGRIDGKGGVGGHHPGTGLQTNGEPGGTALYTRFPIELEVHTGASVMGGGGGGAAGFFFAGGALELSGGGGGAGNVPGVGGIADDNSGTNGTLDSPGLGDEGAGHGGDNGQPGTTGNASSPGAAGNAIDGVSFVTKTVTDGTFAGPEVN